MDFPELITMNYYDGLDIPFAGHVPDDHCRTHTPLYYGIQYIEAGTLRLQIGNGPRRIVTGPAVFITHPGAVFSYRLTPGEQHNYYAVCFTGKRVKRFLDGGLLSLAPRIYPICDSKKFLDTILELIKMRGMEQTAFGVQLVESLLLQLHLSKANTPKHKMTPFQMERLKTLADHIRARYREIWDFSAEARKLFMSERHFRTLFSQVNGSPPMRFLLKIRLERAAEQLLHTVKNIYTIADECGFRDMFYFSRIFKKYYRIAPKQYRMEFGGDVEPPE